MTMQPSGSSGRQIDCDTLRDLLPAYSVGALDADEAAQVEALLPECPEVAEDARAYARLARALQYAAPEAALAGVRPPDELRDRILKESALAAAFLQQSRATTTIPPERDVSRGATRRPLTLPSGVDAEERRPRRPSLLRVGLGIAATLLLVSNVYWITQVESVRRDQDTATAQVQAYATALAIAAAPDARTVDLVAVETSPPLARVSWQPEDDTAVLQTVNLPALSPERAYQFWLIPADGAPVSAGVFQTDANGAHTLIFDMPSGEFAAFGITNEPAGGSPAPTSDPLAVGSLV